MKSRNSIPAGLKDTIRLAVRALSGAQQFGASTGLLQNTAARIEADLIAVIGHDTPGEFAGAQSTFSVQLADLSTARHAARLATKAARLFCQRTIGILKHRFGNQWNGRWQEVGFAGDSLAVPYDPMPLLVVLRAYLGAHPEMENTPLGLTAAQGQLLEAELSSARAAVASAKSGRLTKKRTRDAALRQLQKRLSGLRAELTQLLSPSDGAWLNFGFERPAAGRIPEPVSEVTVTPIGDGQVLVEWSAAPRATNYRVSWQIADEPDTPPTEVGLVHDRSVLVRELPHGAAVTIFVTSRNGSGETAPVEVMLIPTSSVTKSDASHLPLSSNQIAAPAEAVPPSPTTSSQP